MIFFDLKIVGSRRRLVNLGGRKLDNDVGFCQSREWSDEYLVKEEINDIGQGFKFKKGYVQLERRIIRKEEGRNGGKEILRWGLLYGK